MNWRSRGCGMAALCAGGLIAIAIVGPVVWDGFWLALAPAAALLIPTAIDLHAACRPRDGRLGTVGSLLLATAAAGLLALAVLGAAITADLGREPRWLALPELVAGYALIAGALLFGAAAFRTRRVPRWAAAAFAVGIPLGLGSTCSSTRCPSATCSSSRGTGSTWDSVCSPCLSCDSDSRLAQRRVRSIRSRNRPSMGSCPRR
jgi:hypothetical protein